MQAKNHDHYVRAWTDHINELALLALESGVSYEEYKRTLETLKAWARLGADKAFPEVTVDA